LGDRVSLACGVKEAHGTGVRDFDIETDLSEPPLDVTIIVMFDAVDPSILVVRYVFVVLAYDAFATMQFGACQEDRKF
jgi:hypothetical protein